MKRLALLIGLAAFAIVVPAEAKNAHPAHPSHPAQATSGKGHSCAPRKEGYNATGTLVAAALTPSTKKDHYDGMLTVDVTRANHKAPKGSQTFTLSDARVRFGKGVDKTAPAPGSRVHLHGKITVLPHGCSTTGFTPTITIRNVEIKKAK
jgi:hypothetical protein